MKKLDRFLLREMISDGPAGTVYRAEEVLPGDNRRVVALKVMPAVEEGGGESEGEQRFFGEVRVLAQLAVQAHVVTIYAMGITDGHPWLAMEYAATTLAARMGDGAAEVGEVMRMMEQVGKGLAAMHALKPVLVHQDLKPANVLVDVGGNYKVTDFSLATVTAANKTHGLATVRYAAPELLSSEFGRVGPATDLYALGHMAYEMALGGRVHRLQFPAVFEGNSTKEPAPNKWMMWHASMGMRPAALAEVVRGFPPGLSEVIARLMNKAVAERYGSAEELLSDLAVWKHEMAGPAAEPVAAPVAGGERRVARVTPAVQGAVEVAPVRGEQAGSPSSSGAGMRVPAAVVNSGSAAGMAGGGGGARYWVRLRGKVTGPYDLMTLQKQVKQGQISRLHQVSTDQVTWKQTTAVEGLYGPTVV